MKRRLTAIVLITAMCAGPVRQAYADASREYAVKAAFIYNFAQFTEWPASAFPSADSPFVIGVIGANPFDNALEQAVSGKTVHDRNVVVKYLHSIDEIPGCTILYISNSEESHLGEIFSKVASLPILTVGESNEFPDAGGTIQFYAEAKKLRFQISPESANRAELKMSSKLMKLAKIYQK